VTGADRPDEPSGGAAVAPFASVDAYIASFPDDVRPLLESVRATMRAAAPGTEEVISYGIPTFKLGGAYVAYFSGWKKHLAVYPIPSGDEGLTAELAPYVKGAGTLRFPYAKPIPLDLIRRVTEALMAERRARSR
jgi:uncharacterized protein YdhG (YjbR/CyaY superfamily)